MKILLLPKYDRLGASSRLRTFQYLPYLEQQGFKVTVAPLLGNDYVAGLYANRIPWFSVIRSYAHRIKRLFALKSYDLVWLEKELLPWLPAWLDLGIFPKKTPLVVDYDDAVFHSYDLNHNPVIRKFLGKKIDATMQRAELVIAGNDYLADRARLAKARQVEILPTVVDLNRYLVIDTPLRESITIGWIGSPVTAHYLKDIAPTLARLIQCYPVDIAVVGAGVSPVPELSVKVIPWQEQTEVAMIQGFDIGIMPLRDEPFERGKCGYKLIQYMACGKPVVGSPVGANRKIIQSGINGFIASNLNEWFDALSQLCREADLRKRMGKAGRALFENEYALQITAPRLEALLRSVARDNH